MFLSLIIVIVLPHETKAASQDYFILSKSSEELMEYMRNVGIPAHAYYKNFSTIQASLNDEQIAKIKNFDSTAIVQREHLYSVSNDKVIPSFTTIKTEPINTTPYTGKKVKVAVLDTGVDTEHRDLTLAGGYCAFTSDCSSGVPYDDNNGHGTHVAGIIAGKANGTGIIGIAPSVDLYSVKVLNELGVGTTGSIVRGIQWAIDNDIDIMNLSITTTGYDAVMENTLKIAYEKGILLVGAAGNRGIEQPKGNSVTYPAKFDTVIAVGAVDEKLEKLPTSSKGTEVEIVAPGNAIFSTYPAEWDFLDGKQDGYTLLTGTSMAAPHVTGVLALYKERFPAMTNKQLRALLTGLSKDLGTAGRDSNFGFGLLQYERIMEGSPNIVSTVETGKVHLLDKNTKENIKVTVNKKELKKNKNEWIFYGVKGVYPIEITYKIPTGQVIVERKNITIANPVFSDVKPTQWFNEYIGYLANHKQINGFDDGSFQPYKEITRAEAAVLIGRATKLDGTLRKTDLSDVAVDSFASGYIQSAVESKIITGYDDGTFRPENKVTRAEMAILLAKAFNLKPTSSSNNAFMDLSPSMAAYAYIMPIINANVTVGYGDNTFKPYNNITRAEFAAFLARIQK